MRYGGGGGGGGGVLVGCVNMLNNEFLCKKLHRKLGSTFYWGGRGWVYEKHRNDFFCSKIGVREARYSISQLSLNMQCDFFLGILFTIIGFS